MAILYLRSTDGSDSDNGSTWALAKATLAGAFSAASAGDTIYVSQVHAETQASAMTLTSPGTAASPVKVICGNDGVAPPTALASTATISQTSNAAMTFAGFANVYGVTFQNGTGGSGSASINFNSSSAWEWVFDTCSISLLGGFGSNIFVGDSGGSNVAKYLVLKNTTVHFANSGQSLIPRGWLDMQGGSITGTAPAVLIGSNNGFNSCRLLFAGVDLSLVTGTLYTVSSPMQDKAYFENCKLGSGVTITTGSFSNAGSSTVELISCDSGDTNFEYYKANYEGTIIQETTIIRSSGASDGTTALSRKMTSSANTSYWQPLESDWIYIWNETTGSSVNAKIEVVNDGTTLTDSEMWLEVQYSSDASYPTYSFVSDRTTLLASAANQSSSSVTWTTTGLSSPIKQKLDVSFTPQNKGLVKARVLLGKPSKTVYVCPKLELS